MNRAIKADLPIVVTDIQPGFVDTNMPKGRGFSGWLRLKKPRANL